MDLYIQCPKCLNRLRLKEEGWSSTPYCKNCNIKYDVVVNSKEMKIIINERNR